MFALLLALLFWAVVHSVTASATVKAAVRRRIGDRAYEGTYRLAYNLFSAVSLLPIFYLLATQVPERVIWSVPLPYRYLNYAVQLLGAVGLLIALWQTDIWEFAGLRQMGRYLRGEAEPARPSPLVTGGAYGLVRHPLYLFSLLFIWAKPVMTLDALLFDLWVTIYFIIGSYYEERRLLATFGEAYEAYRAQVPRLLPLRLPFSSSPADGT